MVIRQKMFLFIIPLLLINNSFGQRSIKLGTSAVFSGPSKELGQNYYTGAKLYFDKVNDKGGIRGRKIEIIKYDDTYNPAPCINNTIKLISEDNVDLLFNYVGTPTTTAILPLLKIYEQKNVLLFGNFTGAGGQRKYPYKQYVFNVRASYKEETAALVDHFLKSGKKKIGVFYQMDSYGRSGFDGVREKLSKSGLSIVAETTYQRGAQWSDGMLIQAEHMLSREVDAVICVGSYEACAAFIRDARKAGLKAPIANISFVGTEALINILKTNKVPFSSLLFSEVVPHYKNSSLAIIKEYHKSLKERDLVANFISLEGYINAKVLTEIFMQTNLEINRQNMKRIMEEMEPIDIGSGQRMKFTKDIHQLYKQVFIYQLLDDGALSEVIYEY